ncbi:MAG: RecX family transcriptional regulator, partial [Saprospiraceae bacterium]|nr:RecX family transcriptional regulator [Saprospiraceae bacterium]
MIDPKRKQAILRYCTLQDRSHLEVRLKLIHLKVYGEDLEAMMTELIQQDFLNEERFARSFVRGKFRMKGWGREKISRELVRHQLSDYVMRKA